MIRFILLVWIFCLTLEASGSYRLIRPTYIVILNWNKFDSIFNSNSFKSVLILEFRAPAKNLICVLKFCRCCCCCCCFLPKISRKNLNAKTNHQHNSEIILNSFYIKINSQLFVSFLLFHWIRIPKHIIQIKNI